MIKLFDPYISKEEAKAATKVIESKFWASGGGINNVKKFEDSFVKYTKLFLWWRHEGLYVYLKQYMI